MTASSADLFFTAIYCKSDTLRGQLNFDLRPEGARPATEEKSVSQKSEELHNFYDSLMKRQSAEDLLNRHTNRVGDSRQETGKKLLETIKKESKIPVIP